MDPGAGGFVAALVEQFGVTEAKNENDDAFTLVRGTSYKVTRALPVAPS